MRFYRSLIGSSPAAKGARLSTDVPGRVLRAIIRAWRISARYETWIAPKGMASGAGAECKTPRQQPKKCKELNESKFSSLRPTERTSTRRATTSPKGQKQPYGLAPFRSAAVLIQVRKDKGLNRPARYCNSRSGLTIRSGNNPTSTVAATRIGRMGGWVRLSNHGISARRASLKSRQPADPVDHVTG